MEAPDLGNNPLTNTECFMIATKPIKKGDWMTWYYGNFHGIFKSRSLFISDDEEDDVVSSLEDDSDDDLKMAAKLSAQLAEDHKLALEMQQSLDDGVDDARNAKRGAASKPSTSLQDAAAIKPAAAAASKNAAAANKKKAVPSSSSSVSKKSKVVSVESNSDSEDSAAKQRTGASKPSTSLPNAAAIKPAAAAASKKAATTSKKAVPSSSSSVSKKSRVVSVESNSDSEDSAAKQRTGACKRSLAIPVAKFKCLNIDDVCYIASTASNGSAHFQKCYVKRTSTDISTGRVTHYEVSYGNPATRSRIEAETVHADLAAHTNAKQARVKQNLLAREEEQEAIRQDSLQKYQRGELTAPVFGASPGHSPPRVNDRDADGFAPMPSDLGGLNPAIFDDEQVLLLAAACCCYVPIADASLIAVAACFYLLLLIYY